MHTAMHQARLKIAGQPHGVRTWGAYQHYGNPYYRCFDPEAMQSPPRKPTITVAVRADRGRMPLHPHAGSPPIDTRPADTEPRPNETGTQTETRTGARGPAVESINNGSPADVKPRPETRSKK